MEIAITAIGTANPNFKRAQMETAELISQTLHLENKEKRLLHAIYKATGIRYRYSVLPDYGKSVEELEFFPRDPHSDFPTTAERMEIYKKNALHLALKAVENCFQSASHIQKSEITHLITVSCTGMYAPGLDIEITQKLNLASSINRTAINFMGCYGAFNALKLAYAICQSDPEAKVIIVCVELCSIHFQKKFSLNYLLSNAIFADGAAAAIIEKRPAAKKGLSLESFYCDLLPQTSKEMAWTIADHGFDIVLSSYVPQAIESGIEAFFKKFLMKSELTIADVGIYAIHPGGMKILQACQSALGITSEDNRYSYHVLENYGNMSSATILFILKKIWQVLSPKDNNKNIFSCAFGPGLTLEAGIFKVCDA